MNFISFIFFFICRFKHVGSVGTSDAVNGLTVAAGFLCWVTAVQKYRLTAHRDFFFLGAGALYIFV